MPAGLVVQRSGELGLRQLAPHIQLDRAAAVAADQRVHDRARGQRGRS